MTRHMTEQTNTRLVETTEIVTGAPELELVRIAPASPEATPPILFIHGYTAGAWQFAAHVMPALADRGWSTYAINLRGHGGSAGREAVNTARFADYADDLRRTADHIVQQNGGQVPILIGHSLGSVLARDYATRNPVAGLGLTSFGDIKLGMKGFMGWMMRQSPFQGMAGIMTGRPSKMFGNFEPQYAVMYDGHPRDAVRPQVERLMAQPDSDKVFMELGKKKIGTVQPGTPVFVMAGTKDPIASPASVAALADQVGVSPVLLEGTAHDVFAGPDWQAGFAHLNAWLDRLKQANAG